MTKKCRVIFASISLLVLVMAGAAYAATKGPRPWRCKSCDEVVWRENKPSAGRCPVRSYELHGNYGHIWWADD